MARDLGILKGESAADYQQLAHTAAVACQGSLDSID